MKKILLVAFVMLQITAAWSQQAIFDAAPLASPVINDDKSVTFKVKDSLATSIAIVGDWLPKEGYATIPAKMTKAEDGIWSYTSKPLTSDLHTYQIVVDGLTTTDPNNPFVVRDVSTLYNMFIVPSGNADTYKVQNVPHGTVSKRWYESPKLDMQRRLSVYTPAGYETSKEKYPVLYLLHGAGGDEEAWLALGLAAQILDNLIAEGKVKPMLVVMPNGNVIQQAAPGEGIKGFYQPQFMIPKTMDGTYEESFPDIMKFVADNYRIKKGKENTAIAGLSMGGYHSLHISRYYPNTFDYVGLFSAATLPTADKKSPVYENIDVTLEQQKKNGYQLYWIGIGTEDFLYKANTEFKEKLDTIGMTYEYHESGRGHEWTNWRDYLILFLPKLFK
ncbi:esterase [Pustulibacterium marinum]|nr:esterase [Pustulibacterium marinum]